MSGSDRSLIPQGRVPISRRSVACDRGSPCAHCVSARLECTRSLIAPRREALTRQRLASDQYDQKLDAIAEDLRSIKALLGSQHTKGSQIAAQASQDAFPNPNFLEAVQPASPVPPHPNSAGLGPRWDHSAHVLAFLKSVTELQDASPGADKVKSSLNNLIQTLETPSSAHVGANSSEAMNDEIALVTMPPQAAVLEMLRWAKAHQYHNRLKRLCQILPLDEFERICCRVYFAVDAYNLIEYLITNGLLANLFAEHAAIYGNGDSNRFNAMCRRNLGSVLPRLSICLPPSLEAIAAMALGTLYYVEETKASKALALISTALRLCQDLGFHRLNVARSADGFVHDKRVRLFWLVYSLEGGLCFRQGRASAIRDSEILVPTDLTEPHVLQMTRVQRAAYEHLYSTSAVRESAAVRCQWAVQLAEVVRPMIEDTQRELSVAAKSPSGKVTDPMRIVYLQCDMVCQTSLLTLLLRAVRAKEVPQTEDYVELARRVFDLHRQCIESIREVKSEFLFQRYFSWALLHTPFYPFSILFQHTVEHQEQADLDRLGQFAASLRPHHDEESNSPTHPYRLYELLFQAAKLHMSSSLKDATPASHISSSIWNSTMDGNMEERTGGDGLATGMHDDFIAELEDWYQESQQLMGLLDDDMRF